MAGGGIDGVGGMKRKQGFMLCIDPLLVSILYERKFAFLNRITLTQVCTLHISKREEKKAISVDFFPHIILALDAVW